MKKFIKNCLIFFIALMSVIIIGLVLPNNASPRSIDYSIIEKHKILEKHTAPKIILTGGSNVLFGFNSQKLSDSIHKPVINNAIHAGYGLKYILDDILPFINKGDTVVLSPEYSHFFDNNRLGSEPLLFSLTAMPKNIQLLSFHQFIHIAPFIPKFSFDRMKSFLYAMINTRKNSNRSGIYTEFAINQYGDNDQHWDLGKVNFDPYKFEGDFNPNSIKLLIDFQNTINKKGAVLCIVYPSLCRSSFEMNKDRIGIVKKYLESNTFNILGSPQDFVYPDDYFFDTPYHLNGKGVEERNQGVLTLFKQYHD